MKLKILVACEFSGVVRRAFQMAGHDVTSCDMLPAEDNSPNHIQGDVLPLLRQPWDLVIAHPPCTFLCNSGVRWLYGGKGDVRDPVRWRDMEKASEFFIECQNANAPQVCVENPIPHRYAIDVIGRPTQYIQPWQHGHGETKATGLWLRGLPELKPTIVVSGRTGRVHFASPGPDRWKERSRTLPGFASAMASQWG